MSQNDPRTRRWRLPWRETHPDPWTLHCYSPSVCLFLPHQQAGQLEKAQKAYEQAAQSQEKVGSPWHAAKHLETCAAISKDLGQLDRVADYSRQAGSLYALAGRMAAGAQRGKAVLLSCCDGQRCIPAQATQAARQVQLDCKVVGWLGSNTERYGCLLPRRARLSCLQLPMPLRGVPGCLRSSCLQTRQRCTSRRLRCMRMTARRHRYRSSTHDSIQQLSAHCLQAMRLSPVPFCGHQLHLHNPRACAAGGLQLVNAPREVHTLPRPPDGPAPQVRPSHALLLLLPLRAGGRHLQAGHIADGEVPGLVRRSEPAAALWRGV